MQFLQPFTKSRKSVSSISNSNRPSSQISNNSSEDFIEESDSSVNLPETPEDEITSDNQYGPDGIQSKSSLCDELFKPPNKHFKTSKQSISISDVNNSAYEYFQSKKNTSKIVHENKPQDPEVSFLMSVLPDFKEMNADQKRRFKIGILNLAGNILNENTYKPTLEPFNNPTSSASSTMYIDQRSTRFEPSLNDQTSITYPSTDCTQNVLAEFLKYPTK